MANNFPSIPLVDVLRLLPLFREITLVHIDKTGEDEIEEKIHGTGQNLRYFAKAMNLVVYGIDTDDAGELRLWVEQAGERVNCSTPPLL